jgi:hypothetical protein
MKSQRTYLFGNKIAKEIEAYVDEIGPFSYLPGKWLVYCHNDDANYNWEVVKEAHENGLLGRSIKMMNGDGLEEDSAICIYCRKNKVDAFRILCELKKLNLKTHKPLFFKRSIDTIRGKYKSIGDKSISIYKVFLKKSDDVETLTSIRGISDSRIETLRKLSVKTTSELLSYDVSKLPSKSGISRAYFEKLQLQALSIKEGICIELNKIDLPSGNLLFFDLETGLEGPVSNRKIWSAVFLNENKLTHFLENIKNRGQIAYDIADYIRSIKKPILVSFSPNDFDMNVLLNSFKEKKINHNFLLRYQYVNLKNVISDSLILPISNYNLKSIGKALGYKYKNQDMDSVDLVLAYEEDLEKKKGIKKKYIYEIRDKINSLQFIWNKLKTKTF